MAVSDRYFYSGVFAAKEQNLQVVLYAFQGTTDVTAEDQQKINIFNKRFQRLKEIEAELEGKRVSLRSLSPACNTHLIEILKLPCCRISGPTVRLISLCCRS